MSLMARNKPSNQWHIFTVEGLTPRWFPTVSPISENKFVVMGGWQNPACLSDAVIVNTLALTGYKVVSHSSLQFKCDSSSSSTMVTPQHVFSLVHDENLHSYMIKFDIRTNTISIAKDLEDNDELSDGEDYDSENSNISV